MLLGCSGQIVGDEKASSIKYCEYDHRDYIVVIAPDDTDYAAKRKDRSKLTSWQFLYLNLPKRSLYVNLEHLPSSEARYRIASLYDHVEFADLRKDGSRISFRSQDEKYNLFPKEGLLAVMVFKPHELYNLQIFANSENKAVLIYRLPTNAADIETPEWPTVEDWKVTDHTIGFKFTPHGAATGDERTFDMDMQYGPNWTTDEGYVEGNGYKFKKSN